MPEKIPENKPEIITLKNILQAEYEGTEMWDEAKAYMAVSDYMNERPDAKDVDTEFLKQKYAEILTQ